MDWSDEVRARLVREEERLRYKAANLQARGKTVMAAQELVVADDIRAALEEIERLTQDLADIVENDTGQAARAEAAEAEVARLKDELLDRNGHVLILQAKLAHDSAHADQMEDERNKALAEVSRLEGLIVALSEDERGLVTGEVHAAADRIRAALRGGR